MWQKKWHWDSFLQVLQLSPVSIYPLVLQAYSLISHQLTVPLNKTLSAFLKNENKIIYYQPKTSCAASGGKLWSTKLHRRTQI